MKRLVLFIGVLSITVGCWSNAVPTQCPDVLLQGFYWDSYQTKSLWGDTRWSTLQKQCDEIGAYFDGVWLPPSSFGGGVGYHVKQYCNQNSDWGTSEQLEDLITSLHNVGVKVIADIVINHGGTLTGWCDFAPEAFGTYGTFTPDVSWICRTDEVNTDSKSSAECKGNATGSADDGYGSEANYGAARDWDHQSPQVQAMFKAYLQWLINDIHYDGFRYDYGKGFHTSHINDYNTASNPYISFVEYWDGNSSTLIQRLKDAQQNTMTLDFSLKYSAIDGIAKGNYSKCKASGLMGRGYSKYAVNFIDNHDMYARDGNEFGGKGQSMTDAKRPYLLQANAYILCMPGVPCVFYPHWMKYKENIAPMIEARHLAGVHSESEVVDESTAMGYKATITGTNGTIVLLLGDRSSEAITDYRCYTQGDGYAIWISSLQREVPPRLQVTPSCDFTDGIDVSLQMVGGTCEDATIYYTTDGTTPAEHSSSTQTTISLHFTTTTTLKAFIKCENIQTEVQTFTYTLFVPQTTPLVVKFWKPNTWDKVYFYAFTRGTKDVPIDLDGKGSNTWPGMLWTTKDADDWYIYTFSPEYKEVYAIFNAGSGKEQSADLYVDRDVCYYWDSFIKSAQISSDCLYHPTPVEMVMVDAESTTIRKIFRDGQMVIIRAGKEYSVTGTLLK